MTIAESCVLLLSSDELPEVERRIAFVSTDKLGCVGVGWDECEGEVARRGWWYRLSYGGRDLLRLAVRTADVDRPVRSAMPTGLLRRTQPPCVL